jgi:hypothetical protein
MNDYAKFLHEVESFNEKYASIYVNCELEPLVMPFWSWQEIQDGLGQREEWEVDTSLIPFYGDWHDLFCLKEDSGEIIVLDDNRSELCKWASIKDFISSLSVKEIDYEHEPPVQDESPSSDSIERALALKKKH